MIRYQRIIVTFEDDKQMCLFDGTPNAWSHLFCEYESGMSVPYDYQAHEFLRKQLMTVMFNRIVDEQLAYFAGRNAVFHFI